MAGSKAESLNSFTQLPLKRVLQSLGLIAFTVVAWLLDTLLPDGFSGNLLYILPLVIASALGLGQPYLWAAVGTVLAASTPVLAPRGLALPWEVADRLLTIGVLWFTSRAGEPPGTTAQRGSGGPAPGRKGGLAEVAVPGRRKP